MKKTILIAFLFTNFISFSTNAQSIDSISVHLSKIKNQEFGPWDFYYEVIDSFATSQLISSLKRNRGINYWINSSYTNYSYTGSVLIEKIEQTWNNQWINSSKVTYTYSATVDSSLLQKWNSTWENDKLTITNHGSNGLDSLILIQKWKNNMWRNFTLTENNFAPDSTLLTQTISNWDTIQSLWNNKSRSVYNYDSSGFQTAVITQYYNSGLGVWNNDVILYYYGSVYGWDNADSAFTISHGSGEKDYDSLGRLIHSTFQGLPGGFSESYYTYDANGVLVYTFNHSETQGGFREELITECVYYDYPDSTIYLFTANDTITMCKGDSIPVGFYAFGGTSQLHYQWSPSTAVNSDTNECPNFIADSSTALLVMVSDNIGNSGIATIFADVSPLPYLSSIQSIPTCIGCSTGVFILTMAGGTGNVYYNINPRVMGASYGVDTISGLPEGIYTICLYDSRNCSSCIIDTIFSTNVKIVEIPTGQIKLFPNPFNSMVEIQLPRIDDKTYLDWYDQLGKNVRKDELFSGNNTLMKNNLLTGCYTGILRSGERIISRIKIMVIE